MLLFELDLHKLSLLEVPARNDVPHVLEDRMELYESVRRVHQKINQEFKLDALTSNLEHLCRQFCSGKFVASPL